MYTAKSWNLAGWGAVEQFPVVLEHKVRSRVTGHRCHATSMNGWQDESRHHPGRTTMAYAITTTESWGDTWTQWRQGVVTAIRNDFS